MKKYIWIVSIIVSIILISCGNQNEFPKIDYKYGEHVYKHGPCDSLTYECVDINIKTVEIVNAPNQNVKDSVESKIKEFVLSPTVSENSYNSFNELRDSLIENYKHTRKEIPDMKIGYELIRNVKVETDTLGVFAVDFYQFNFFGGAHPNYFTTYSNIDILNGRTINLDELLNPGYEKKLNSEAELIFRDSLHIPVEANLEEQGYWFENGRFKLNNNFLITKNGLKFFFNSYEIAPYSFGTTELLIPYVKIKSIIKEKSIIDRFIK